MLHVDICYCNLFQSYHTATSQEIGVLLNNAHKDSSRVQELSNPRRIIVFSSWPTSVCPLRRPHTETDINNALSVTQMGASVTILHLLSQCLLFGKERILYVL